MPATTLVEGNAWLQPALYLLNNYHGEHLQYVHHDQHQLNMVSEVINSGNGRGTYMQLQLGAAAGHGISALLSKRLPHIVIILILMWLQELALGKFRV